MPVFNARHVCAGAATLVVLALQAPPSRAQSTAIVLEPHRAVYDLALDGSRRSGSITAVKGRMVYEITGSACDGWTQTMRFVTQMTGQEENTTLTDLRSSTFEDSAFKQFRFSSTQARDERNAETTQGDATRDGDSGTIKVDLVKPVRKSVTLQKKALFPVQQSIAILEAARAGTATLRADLYDGSDKGEKVYDTKSTIGSRLGATAVGKLPVIKGAERLDGLPAWPVTMSYYELGQDKLDATPVYELSYVFFENGVSRRLLIDYGDFALRGDLREITFLDAGQCTAK